MLKVIKKVILGSVSILGMSFMMWTFLLLNPNWVYGKSMTIDNVTVYYNSDLETSAENTIKKVLEIVSSSEIYKNENTIQLCMNDNSIYPNLHPVASGTAYAFLNKTVIFSSSPNFRENTAEFQWEINNYELRKYNLTYLLAHEFMHNVQYEQNKRYSISTTFGKQNWKLEGHADYIARQFKNDGLLKTKIRKYLTEAKKKHVGIPVFELEDGTIQNLSYYKFALVVQFLMEERGMDFDQICQLDTNLNDLFNDMINWSQS